MRTTVMAVALLLTCAAPAGAEECVDVVGGPADDLVKAAGKRSATAVDKMRQRALELISDAELPPGQSQTRLAAEIHRDNLRALKEVEREQLLARLFTPSGSCRALAADRAFELALGQARFSAERTSQSSAQYGLYVGPNFSLGGAGDWRPGAETLARFDTEVFSERDPGYGWLEPLIASAGWLRGYAEASYQSINALEEAEDTASGEVPAQNLFASAGGYLRLNAGLQLHFTGWYGLQLGVGLSSLPNSDNVTRMEPRAFAGLHFQTLFRDGAVAQLFLGGAYDEFWEREVFDDPNDPLGGTHVERHFGRYNLDGLIFLPGQVGNFHLAARLFADAPIDGAGPSDLRVSLLAYYDFNDWLNTFVPIRNAISVSDSLRGPGL